jgi:hypothetical protein
MLVIVDIADNDDEGNLSNVDITTWSKCQLTLIMTLMLFAEIAKYVGWNCD